MNIHSIGTWFAFLGYFVVSYLAITFVLENFMRRIQRWRDQRFIKRVQILFPDYQSINLVSIISRNEGEAREFLEKLLDDRKPRSSS